MPPLWARSPAYDSNGRIWRRTRPNPTPGAPAAAAKPRRFARAHQHTKKAARPAPEGPTATAAAPHNAHSSVYTRTALAAARAALSRHCVTQGLPWLTRWRRQHTRKRRRRIRKRRRRIRKRRRQLQRRKRPSTNYYEMRPGTRKRARARKRRGICKARRTRAACSTSAKSRHATPDSWRHQ